MPSFPRSDVGSLEVAPGVRLVDTPELPEAWKPNTTHRRITVAD